MNLVIKTQTNHTLILVKTWCLHFIDVCINEKINLCYCGPGSRVKTFFSSSLGFLPTSKPLQLLDYARCNASYFCNAMTLVNTEIPKQCDALCDRDNTSLLSRH